MKLFFPLFIFLFAATYLKAGREPEFFSTRTMSQAYHVYQDESALRIRKVSIICNNHGVAAGVNSLNTGRTRQFNLLSWDGRIRFTLGKNMVLAFTYK